MGILHRDESETFFGLGKTFTHEHSSLLKFLNFNVFIGLQQLNCVTHLASRSVALVGFLNIKLVGTQKAPDGHAEVVSDILFEGYYGSRGIQNCYLIAHAVRHISSARVDGYFKHAVISTFFPEFFIDKCFRLIQIVWWQAFETLTIRCEVE